MEAATARGIPVGHTPDVLTEATADLALALMLGIARDAWWRATRSCARRVATRGSPGSCSAATCTTRPSGSWAWGGSARRWRGGVEGFGVEVLHSGRSGGIELGELLERSDFVSLHCPLTPETRGLIGAEALARMKPTAYLVNTARGPIVDTAALIAALERGEIAGAALDVTDPEPLPGDHPLLDAPNLLVLPHLGSATHATRERMADMAVDNLLAGLAGERMPHCVNPEVYERG